MKSAGKARNNGLYRHIRTSKEIIRNLLNDCLKNQIRDKLLLVLIFYRRYINEKLDGFKWRWQDR